MKHLTALVVAGLLASTALPAAAADIRAPASTFVYPILAKWADAYKKHTGIGLNYQSIGSGGGIKQITNKTVTFGASDMPLKSGRVDKNSLVQFPIINGAVVPVVNLPGIKPVSLIIDGPTLAKIYLGQITKWNDPAITKLNPSVKLPVTGDRCRAPLGRFRHHLHFDQLSVQGQPRLEAKGRREHRGRMARRHRRQGQRRRFQQRSQTKGSIGYVEYAYALQNKMTYAKMINQAGKTVSPTSGSVPSRRRRRRLDLRSGFPRDHDGCSRRQVLAVAGCDLYPDAANAADPADSRCSPQIL